VATQFSAKVKKALSYTSIPPHVIMVCKPKILLDLTKINGGDERVPSDKITLDLCLIVHHQCR
jgi:hypothetical protein